MKSFSHHIESIMRGFAVLGLLAGSPAWAGDDIETIVIFGDSLSDPGNLHALTGAVSMPPYNPVPTAPYAIGGFQFSNGKTWAQVFARELENNRDGSAALVNPGKFTNYAFGGARARADSGVPVPSAGEQLGLYLADSGGAADAQALYVVQFGGNDLRDVLALLMTTGDLAGAKLIVADAIAAEAAVIQDLYARGARRFLVANVPNLGRAPAIVMSGPGAVYFASLFADAYNDGLDTAVAGLGALPGIRIDRLDFFTILEDMAANPADYGLTETDAPCLIFFVAGGAICSNPNRHLFWDGVHPTAAVHRIVGRQAADIYDD